MKELKSKLKQFKEHNHGPHSLTLALKNDTSSLQLRDKQLQQQLSTNISTQRDHLMKSLG